MLDPENLKNINHSPWGAEISRLTWHNPFGHRSTRSALLDQNDQNALGQFWVDRKSKLVKIITKQYFSCFYIKPKLLGDFVNFDLKLTLEGPKNPNSFSMGPQKHLV